MDNEIPSIKTSSFTQGSLENRQLHGILLWMARGIYALLFLGVFYLQVEGIKLSRQKMQEVLSSADIDIRIEKTQENQFQVNSFRQDYASGIEVRDIILKIDGHALSANSDLDEVNAMLRGRPGEPVTVTVQKK
jgi:hypothetical protein